MQIDELQLGCIEEYASGVGRSADECIYEALDDYIRTVIWAASQNEPMNVIGFPERVSV